MALTQNDLNKLSLVVSEVIDKKLDEKFDPIMDKVNLLSKKVEELYTRLGALLDRLDKSLLRRDSLIRKIRTTE